MLFVQKFAFYSAEKYFFGPLSGGSLEMHLQMHEKKVHFQLPQRLHIVMAMQFLPVRFSSGLFFYFVFLLRFAHKFHIAMALWE
jgi:hypothetical protein